MTNHPYDAELKLLKQLAVEFSLANPALAPLLEGEMADPDVERLLEAIVYQNAMLRRKLDADFPELVNKLTHLILPHYLRSIPASTIIAFTPNVAMRETVLIPAGAVVASAPVDGTPCRFTTTRDVAVHPLELVDADLVKQARNSGQIRLSLVLSGTSLAEWQPEKLRFFLSGDHASASELYLLLSRYLKRIILTPAEGGAAMVLPPSCLKSTGFAENEALLPYPPHAFSGYRLLQEYFTAPEKFLFFELSGWENWECRGEGSNFAISFEFSEFPAGYPRIRRESFALHCVPAINIFSHQAYPISLDHRADSYLVRPAGSNPAHYQVLSVDSVTGFSHKHRAERRYHAFEQFDTDLEAVPLYHTIQEKSPHGSNVDVHLSIVFPGEIPPADAETLSIDLICTNGALPESLHIGDVCLPVSDLPDMVSLRNITAIAPRVLPPFGPNQLWQLTTHLYLNHLSLENVEHLRTLLELYVFPDNRSGAAMGANLKRIAGIESLGITAAEQLVSGIAMKGRDIGIRVRQDHFAGVGDLYLFGCVLDNFLGRYASLNTFTRLTINDSMRGGSLQWPIRLGRHLLR